MNLPEPDLGSYDPKNPNYDDLPECVKTNDWGEEYQNYIECDGYMLRRTDKSNYQVDLRQWAFLRSITKEDMAEQIELWKQIRESNLDQKVWLCGVDLTWGHYENIELFLACLKGANLCMAHLEGANLYKAQLDGANLGDAHLEGADLYGASLKSASFYVSNLNGACMAGIKYDSATSFSGSNFCESLMHPADQGALQYNIRRLLWMQWKDGLDKNGHATPQPIWWPIRQATYLFWWISDFGISTKRIVKAFLFLSCLFALLYWCCPWMLDGKITWEQEPTFKAFVHDLYFSVVTMTTLGFGDVHAKAECWQGMIGQSVLMIHVIIGYVLLGSLVTRLGIVFTGLGPVSKPKLSNKDEELQKIWNNRWLNIKIIIGVVCFLLIIIRKYILYQTVL